MANYRGCQVNKYLQRIYYDKNIPIKKYNLRKDVNYSSIINKDSGEKTNPNLLNIRDTKYFPNLNSHSLQPNTPKNMYPNVTANQSESNIIT